MSDGRVVIDSYLDPSGAEAGWAQLQGKMESGAQKVGNIGKTLTQTVTAPLVAAGTAAFKFSMDQETAFAKVSTLLTGSESEMEAYKRAIRTASNDMGVSFDEYSEAVYQSISANIDQAEAIGFTEKAVRLAKGGFTDTATAVDIMTTAINAYGLEAEDADHVTDVLINTQNQGKTTVDELAASMGKVIPVAEMNNVSLEQLSTGYAVLTRNGISTAEAGTYLRAMFDELGKSGSDVDDILRERTGKSFAELQAEGYNTADVLGILQEEADETGLTVTDFFGSTQAGTAAMTLLSGEGKEFNEILESMGEATGSTEAAFDKMNETAEQKLFNALNRVRNVLAELGDIFLPLVADAADWASQVIEELSTRFFTLDEDTQRTTVAIAAAAAAIGPLLMTVPLLAKAVGLLGTGFSMLFSPIGTVVRVVASLATGATTLSGVLAALTGPIGLVVVAVAGLIAIGVQLYRNWDTMKERFEIAFSAFQPLIETTKAAFQNLLDSLNPIWDSLKQLFESILPILTAVGVIVVSVVVSAFGLAISIFNATVSAIGPLINAFVNMVDFVVNVFMVIISIITLDFASALEYWERATENAIQFFLSLWDGVVNFFSTFINTIVDFFYGLYMTLVGNSIIPDMVNAIVQWFRDMWTWLVELVQNIVNGVRERFQNMAEAVQTQVQRMRERITQVWTAIRVFFSEILSNIISNVRERFQNMVETIQTRAQNSYDRIRKIWSSIKNFFTQTLSEILSNLRQRFQDMVNSVRDRLNDAKNRVNQIWSEIKSFFTQTLSNILNNLRQRFQDMANSVRDRTNDAKSRITEIWSEIKSFFTETLSDLWNTVREKFQDIVDSVRDRMNDVKDTAIDIWNEVQSFFEGIDLYQIGRDIIQGLWRGISGMAGTLKRNVSKFIDDNIPGPVKKVLGINSPSKLMEEEVGEPVGEGTEIGIDNKYKDIAAAAKRMASAAIPKIEEPAIPAFAVAGPPTNDQGTNEPHNYRNNREQPVTAIFQINDREFARATAYASEEEKQRREKLESRAGGDF